MSAGAVGFIVFIICLTIGITMGGPLGVFLAIMGIAVGFALQNLENSDRSEKERMQKRIDELEREKKK